MVPMLSFSAISSILSATVFFDFFRDHFSFLISFGFVNLLSPRRFLPRFFSIRSLIRAGSFYDITFKLFPQFFLRCKLFLGRTSGRHMIARATSTFPDAQAAASGVCPAWLTDILAPDSTSVSDDLRKGSVLKDIHPLLQRQPMQGGVPIHVF